jgi:hypothetical protein
MTQPTSDRRMRASGPTRSLPRRRSRGRRLLRTIAAGAVVGLLGIVAHPLWLPALVRPAIEAALQQAIGDADARITVGALEAGLDGRVVARDVELHGEIRRGRVRVTRLMVRRIGATISLGAVITGRSGVADTVRTIEIAGVTAAVELSDGPPPADPASVDSRPAAADAGARTRIGPVPRLPEIRISDADVVVRGPGGAELHLAGASAAIGSGRREQWRLRAQRVWGALQTRRLAPAPAALDAVRTAGEWRVDRLRIGDHEATTGLYIAHDARGAVRVRGGLDLGRLGAASGDLLVGPADAAGTTASVYVPQGLHLAGVDIPAVRQLADAAGILWPDAVPQRGRVDASLTGRLDLRQDGFAPGTGATLTVNLAEPQAGRTLRLRADIDHLGATIRHATLIVPGGRAVVRALRATRSADGWAWVRTGGADALTIEADIAAAALRDLPIDGIRDTIDALPEGMRVTASLTDDGAAATADVALWVPDGGGGITGRLALGTGASGTPIALTAPAFSGGFGSAALSGSARVDLPRPARWRGLLARLTGRSLDGIDGRFAAVIEFAGTPDAPQIDVRHGTVSRLAVDGRELLDAHGSARFVAAPDGSLALSALDVAATGLDAGRADRLTAALRIDPGTGRVMSASVDLAVSQLRRYAGLWSVAVGTPASGSLAILLDGAQDAATGEFVGDLTTTGSDLMIGDTSIGDVRLAGIVGPQRLAITAATLSGEWGRVDAAGEIRRPAPDATAVRFQAAAAELRRAAPLLRLAEPAEFVVTLARPAGSLRDLLLTPPPVARIAVARPINIAGPAGSARIQGGLGIGPERSNLLLRGADIDLAALAPVLVPELRAAGIAGRLSEVRLSIDGRADDPTWRAGVTAVGLDAAALLADLPAGSPLADANVVVSGSRRRGRIEQAEISLRPRAGAAAGFSGEPLARLTLDGSAPFDPLAWLTSLHTRLIAPDSPRHVTPPTFGFGEPALTARLDVPRAARLAAQLGLDTVGDLRLPDGRVDLRLGLAGTWRAPAFSLAGTANDVRWNRLPARRPGADARPPVGERLAALPPMSISLAGRLEFGAEGSMQTRKTGRLTIDGVTVTVDRDRARLHGAAELHVRAAPPGENGLDMQMHGGSVTVVAQAADIGRYPLDLALGAGGTASGPASLGMTIAAPWAAPLVTGTFRQRGGRWRLPVLPPIDNVETEVSVTPDRVIVRRFAATMGAVPVTAFGAIPRGPGGPEGDDANAAGPGIRIRGRDVLIRRLDGVNLRADLDLRLHGGTAAPRLSGSVGVTSGIIQRSPLLLSDAARADGVDVPGIDVPILGDAALAVRVAGLGPVSIATPRLIGEVRPQLTLLGTVRRPRPVGVVRVSDAALAVGDTAVSVAAGEIRFPEAGPAGHPQLDMAGTTTTHGYRVRLALTGTALDPDLALTSVPPLPPQEILTMLVTGEPPDPLRLLTIERPAGPERVAVFIGAGVLRRILGPDPLVRERNLEAITVDAATGVSESGRDTFEVRYVLADRFIGGSTRLEAEVTRDRYDEFNAGLSLSLRIR